MNQLHVPSEICSDVVSGKLKGQMITLQKILNVIEKGRWCCDDYVIRSLKTVEMEIRCLRKYIDH